MKRQEELRKMVAEATPGPWGWTKEEYDDGRSWHLSPGVLILDMDGGGPDGPDEFDNANAALIVQAPTLATDLANALEREARLREALEPVRDALAAWQIVLRNGRMVDASITGLGDMIRSLEAALTPKEG